MNKSSLVNPVAGATGVFIALAAALVAALVAAFFVFDAKEAGAQSQNVEVKPSTINLGQVAQEGSLGQVSTEQTTIRITNDGSSATEIGGINFDGNGADLVKLVDQETDEEFIVDTATGLLENLLGDPAGIDLQGNSQRVFNAVFQFTGEATDLFDIGGTLEFLDADPLTNTVIDTVTVAGQSRQCTVEGTEGDDPNLPDVPGETVICGFGGNDTIDASLAKAANGGADVILGGTGNDTINMKDGLRREYANGGSGKDLCKPKDKKDRVKSCGTKGGKRR